MNNDNILDEEEEQTILDEARQDIYNWYTYFTNNYYEGRLDKYFLLVDQWDDDDKEDLKRQIGRAHV